MSFQYINPYYSQIGSVVNQNNALSPVLNAQNFQVTNPYQTNLYDEKGVVLPYGILNNSLGTALNHLNQAIGNLQFQPQNEMTLNSLNYNLPYNVNSSYVNLGTITNEDGRVLHLYRLQNGQRVAILPVKDEATIVKTYLDGGSMNEKDDVRGISHTIEHCLFKGSSKLADGDVFKLTGLMGASTNASTDYAQTDYYITAPFMTKSNLAKTIEIQGDMISNPIFEKNALESEKNPICSEISMMNDGIMSSAFDKVVRNLFQIETNSEHLVAGSIATVQGLSRDDVVSHHKTYYTPDKLYTVVVGDVNPDETIKEIAKNFTLPSKTTQSQEQYKMPLNPIQSSIREDIRSSKTKSTNVFLAFSGPKPKDAKDFIVCQILNYYMSQISTSGFKKTLEDLNAAYDFSLQKVGLADNDPYAMMNAIQVMPNDEQKAIDAFYDAILKLQTTPLADADLQAVKNAIKKDSKIAMSDSEALCDTIGDAFLDKSFDIFINHQGILDSITQQDIIDFAKKYYDLSKASIVVVHPTDVSTDDIKRNYESSKYSFSNAQKTSQNNSVSAFQLNQSNQIPMMQNAYINQAVANYGPKSPYLKAASNVQVKEDGNISVDTNSIKQMLLPNNMHVALNKTSKDMCVFDWSVNTAPIRPKNPNIPAVLSYMFQKGSEYKNQEELERIKELNAIDAEVFVNEKGIKIVADCLPEHASKTLLLMNELMYSPKLTQNDFETAKKHIKDSLLATEKDAATNLLDKLYPGFFPTEATMLKTIDALTLDDVKDFYRSLLANASSSFVATLPENNFEQSSKDVVDIQSATNFKFKKHVQTLTPIFQPTSENVVVWDTDDLNQAQISKAYKFPLSGNIVDEVKFELVNTILGASPNARLFSDLREKQNLAYSVSSSIQQFENTGILTLKIQTTTDNKEAGVQSFDNVQKSLEGFNKHTQALCSELVSDDELQAAKTRLKQKLVGDCQNPLSETSLLAMSLANPYGIGRIDKYFEAIDKITKEDIKNAANFIFSNKPTVSILASPDTINNQMDYLKTQGTLYQAQ